MCPNFPMNLHFPNVPNFYQCVHAPQCPLLFKCAQLFKIWQFLQIYICANACLITLMHICALICPTFPLWPTFIDLHLCPNVPTFFNVYLFLRQPTSTYFYLYLPTFVYIYQHLLVLPTSMYFNLLRPTSPIIPIIQFTLKLPAILSILHTSLYKELIKNTKYIK